jgi:hypothetical protein
VIVFFEDHFLAHVPLALRARRVEEHEKHVREVYGVNCFESAPGCMRVDISRTTAARAIAFLTAENALCVNIEAADVAVFLGRSPLSHACMLYVETHPQEFQSILVEEIADRLTSLAHLVNDAGSAGPDADDAFMAEMMLQRAGFDLPPAVDIDYKPTIDRTAELNAWADANGFGREDRDVQNAWRPSMPDDDFLL